MACVVLLLSIVVTHDNILSLQVAPALTFPLFFFVAYDFPRDRPVFYQIYLTLSTWCWAWYQILFMSVTDFGYIFKGRKTYASIQVLLRVL